MLSFSRVKNNFLELVFLASVALAGCAEAIIEPQYSNLPKGNYLYCIANGGNNASTMVVYDVDNEQLTTARATLDLDSAGPWFANQTGYYLARVHYSGKGKNLLVAFDPVTLREKKRLQYRANSNPTQFIYVADKNTATKHYAYVGLAGAFNDSYRTIGISEVNLITLKEEQYLDLRKAPNAKHDLTDLVQLTYHADCNGSGTPCIYALFSNYNVSGNRPGKLVVLTWNALDALEVKAVHQLPTDNAQQMLIGSDKIYVINNGGYKSWGGSDGSLTEYNRIALYSASPLAAQDQKDYTISGDPNGIYLSPTGDQLWITSFAQAVRTFALSSATITQTDLNAENFFSANSLVFAAISGVQPSLAQINANSLGVDKSIPLNAGSGPLTCEAHSL